MAFGRSLAVISRSRSPQPTEIFHAIYRGDCAAAEKLILSGAAFPLDVYFNEDSCSPGFKMLEGLGLKARFGDISVLEVSLRFTLLKALCLTYQATMDSGSTRLCDLAT